jgi:hypothetical protein
MKDIKFTEWASRSEMLDKLRDKRLIILESGADGVHRYYKLDLPAGHDDVNVVILSTGHGEPSAVWLETQSKLILACDTSVHKLDLATKKVEYSKKLDGIFYKFLRVEWTGACTVLHQLGVLSIQPDGTNRWNVNTGIIEDFQCYGADSIELKIVDEESKEVNIKTGAVIDLRPINIPTTEAET